MIKPLHKLGCTLQNKVASFYVWAPNCKSIDVMNNHEQSVLSLKRHSDGYFAGTLKDVTQGFLYKYRINNKSSYPDPYSNFQPYGPHGPSMMIDHRIFAWSDHVWQRKGLELKGQVIYELHIGTFTPEGTYAAATRQLPELKKLGISVIELMPLAECPGARNWGYDGVDLFAPYHVYGSNDDLKNLINQAHRLGIGVVLDVVYNHIGPDGNYLKVFSHDYFTKRYKTDWGEAINFDGKNKTHSREFFLQNASYWIKHYHFDGLRLDATQNMYDRSSSHILAELSNRVRKEAAPKKILLIAENESQERALLMPIKEGGYGLDAVWNDDFHHSARVAMTGHREAYYTDYLGQVQEFISCIKRGYLYQGQYYTWQKQPRGEWVDQSVDEKSFIFYIQNHDQVANSFDGHRIHLKTELALYRCFTALQLLAPQTPMLFMGQEFASSKPFLFFTDHNAQLAPLVHKGRKSFLKQFPSIAKLINKTSDPNATRTYEVCVLDFKERVKNRGIYQLHKDLLKIRREDEVFQAQNSKAIEAAVLAEKVFILRYKGRNTDRLVAINLGDEFIFSPAPEPLLAPLPFMKWKRMWSSEDVNYGGAGTREGFDSEQWHFPAQSTQVFTLHPGSNTKQREH